ncbi:TPA: hypothetical protein ACYSE6_006604 [Pseudomonas aeruginosa]
MSNEEQKDATPADYVYTGRRVTTKGKVCAAIQIVGADGQLGEVDLYDLAVAKGKTIGGIYRGASFYQGGSNGLKAASWASAWQDPTARADWLARDEAAGVHLRMAKLEADSKKAHEIDELLLPLRKLYARYAQTRDYAGQEALEAAVMRSLRRRPRADQ